jgi:hypothetical protein
LYYIEIKRFFEIIENIAPFDSRLDNSDSLFMEEKLIELIKDLEYVLLGDK